MSHQAGVPLQSQTDIDEHNEEIIELASMNDDDESSSDDEIGSTSIYGGSYLLLSFELLQYML